MKTKKTRIVAEMVAVLLLVTSLPLSVLAANNVSSYSVGDYTPFLLEAVNGKAVYNEQTADMSYNLYMAARSYIDDGSKTGSTIEEKPKDSFSFTYANQTYTPSSVYSYHPTDWKNTCGALTGILNFKIGDGENATVKHVALVVFRGTEMDRVDNITTDLKFEAEDGYHLGFYKAARNHYNEMTEHVTYDLGDGSALSFGDYIAKMKSGNDDYTMIVTGHSLGAAVAGIFVSKYLDDNNGLGAENVVGYTFASPLTCTTAEAKAKESVVTNLFNFINKDDVVTKVGCNGLNGDRTGKDLRYNLNKYNMFNTDNHHMSTAYKPILAKVNEATDKYVDSFVLYTNYTLSGYQRVVYANGVLMVSGFGALKGDWSQNTTIDIARIKDKCTALIFSAESTISEIGESAFMELENLSGTLTLPNTLTKVGAYAFYNCDFTGKLTLPASLIKVGEKAFAGCTSLSQIDFSAINTTYFECGANAFQGCVGAENLILPSTGVQTQDISAFGFAFDYEKNGVVNHVVVNSGSATEVVPTGESYTVERGSKIYCRILDETKLESNVFDFVFLITLSSSSAVLPDADYYTNYNNLIKVDPSTGVVEISPSCPAMFFRVGAYYRSADGSANKNVRHYYMDFNVIGESGFAGGIGTAERPYQITSREQLNLMVNASSSAHFILMNDINCDGGVLDSIGVLNADGDAPVSSFEGVFDGNGHTISNATITQAWFRSNNGVIKNVTLKNVSVTSDQKQNAILVARNEENGIIENCHVVDSSISVTYKHNSSNCWLTVGGICGINVGKINACSIRNSTLYGNARGGDNHYDVYNNIGGIVSRTYKGSITNCAAYDNTITAHIYHNGTLTNHSTAYFRLGGLIAVGEKEENTTLSSSYHYNNVITYTRDFYNHKGYNDGEKSAFLGHAKLSSGVALSNDMLVGEAIENSQKPSVSNTKTVASVVVERAPYRTNYFVGEALSLSGLLVKVMYDDDSSEILTHGGFSVSGFDSSVAVNAQTLQVSFGGKSASLNVCIRNVEPEKIVVYTAEENYQIGSAIKLSDLSMRVYFNNGVIETYHDLTNAVVSPQQNLASSLKSAVAGYTIGIYDPDLSLSNTGMVVKTVTVIYAPGGMQRMMQASFAVNAACAHTAVALKNACVATEDSCGYTGDYVCAVCSEIVVSEVYPVGIILEPIAASHTHVFDQQIATDEYLKTAATCTKATEYYLSCVCGSAGAETFFGTFVADHQYKNWATKDNDQHQGVCECGAVGYEAHAWDDGFVATSATPDQVGVKMYTCTVCGEINAVYNFAEVLVGDINADGRVDEEDATLLMQYVAGWNVEADERTIDTNGSGSVNNKDVTRLLQYLAGHNVTMEAARQETPEGYTVVWRDYNGRVISVKTGVASNSTVANPVAPERAGYTFVGWDQALTNVTDDMVVTAVYEKASTDPAFVVDKVSATAGDQGVQVKIALKNNPGIASMKLVVTYDEALTLTGITYNNEIGGMSQQPQTKDSPVVLNWFNGIANSEGDFVFVTLSFDVASTATGECAVAVSYNRNDVYNIDETNLNFTVINGGVVIAD